MFPGLLVWGTFSIAFTLTFIKPLWLVVFILIFDLLWLYRVIYFNIFVLISWRRYKKVEKKDWQALLPSLPGAKNIYHLIFLPTYKESYEIVRSTLRALKENHFPNERLMIVLGGEESDKDTFEKVSRRAEQEFGSIFKYFGITLHPKGLSDEIPGKGSNLNWMGHETEKMLKEYFPEIPDEDIVVSAFDIDTVAHPSYFSYLTYLYCTVPNPTRSSYQPIALFSNNIWTASAPVCRTASTIGPESDTPPNWLTPAWIPATNRSSGEASSIPQAVEYPSRDGTTPCGKPLRQIAPQSFVTPQSDRMMPVKP